MALSFDVWRLFLSPPAIGCTEIVSYHLLYTAKAAFIYVLHMEPYAYVDAHRHRCVLAQPKGQLSIANYL